MKQLLPTLQQIIHRNPLFVVFVLLSVGIVCSNILYAHTIYWILAEICSILCTLFSAWKIESKRIAVYLLALGIFLMGMLAYSLFAIQHPPFITTPNATYIATVNKIKSNHYQYVTADLHIKNKHIKAHLEKHTHETLSEGDKIIIHGKINPISNKGIPYEFDYAAYAYHQGFSGKVNCPAGRWQKMTDSSPHLILRLRRYFSHKLSLYFNNEKFDLLSALSLGDKSTLQKNTKQLFSDTGTAHILALSGLHLAILFSFFNLLIVLLPLRKIKIISILLGFICIWAYAALTGFPLSIIRSCIMLSIAQTALLFHREVLSINNLSLAGILILICSPNALFDISFQLSFLAVFFIILLHPLFFSPKIATSNRILYFFYTLLTVSLSAQIGAAPLMGYYFHLFSPYSIVTSAIVIPLIYPLLFLTLIFFISPAFLLPILSEVIKFILDILLSILSFFQILPGHSVKWYPLIVTLLLIYTLILLIYQFIILKRKKLLYAIYFTLCAWIIISFYQKHIDDVPSQIIIYKNYEAANLHLIINKEHSYLWWKPQQKSTYSSLDEIKECFWRRKNMTSPHTLTSKYEDTHIIFHPPLVLFGSLRMAVVDKTIKQCAEHPLMVHYLYLCKGAKNHLSELLLIFQPKCIILDTSLSQYYHERYSSEAKAMKIPMYDLTIQPTFIVNVK